MLVPLSTFFAVPDRAQHRMNASQKQILKRWFWRSCFSRRYSSAVLRNLKTDIGETIRLRVEGNSQLADFNASVDERFFIDNRFAMGRVNTKTFILLLAQMGPRSFLSGRNVTLEAVMKDYNRNEFHHIYPKQHLATIGNEKIHDSVLANLCFLSKADNNQIGGRGPSSYKAMMDTDHISTILGSAAIPSDFFEMPFEEFVFKRAGMLAAFAEELID